MHNRECPACGYDITPTGITSTGGSTDIEPLIEDVRRALTEIPPGQGSVLIAPRHAQALVDEIGRLRALLSAFRDASIRVVGNPYPLRPADRASRAEGERLLALLVLAVPIPLPETLRSPT